MKEIFSNKPAPDSPFYAFMNSIAKKVDMLAWDGYERP